MKAKEINDLNALHIFREISEKIKKIIKFSIPNHKYSYR